MDGHEHADFDALAMTVTLPHSTERQTVRVRLVAAAVAFSADTLEVAGGAARISLAGSLTPQRLPVLREAVESALDSGCTRIVLEAADLVFLDAEGTRYLAYVKQQRDFALAVVGANGQVEAELRDSELNQELVR